MELKLCLTDHSVLQRNKNNVSEHRFSGSCSSQGTVWLTAEDAQGVIKGFEKLEAGSADGKKFQGVIAGLPVGGPYKLKISIGSGREKLLLKDIFVGDLWLLAGQSNMADSGLLPSQAEVCSRVKGFYMDNHWDTARDPLHDIMHAAAPVHGGRPSNPKAVRYRGAGPGVPFGIEMEKLTGVPQGLIACAHGGTSMSQWDPAKKKLKGRSLYGALYERLQMLGGKVRGVVWYQGCNETGSDENVERYEKALCRLFAAFRRDCRDPELPIVFGQLAACIKQPHIAYTDQRWLKVRDAQYRVGQTLRNTVCVPTIDLEMDDPLHMSAQGVKQLGERFARAAFGLMNPGAVPPEIAFASARCTMEKDTHCAKVHVKFKNVQGKLTAPGLASGFSVVDKNGQLVGEAINVRLDGDTAVVQTAQPYLLFAENYCIAYGGMLQPHANITDEAGRSLPCFMHELPRSRCRISSTLDNALVSQAIYGADDYLSLALPGDLIALDFKPAAFSGFFLPCPREAGELNTEPKQYCYKFAVNASEDMQVDMLFGADASFVIYQGNKELFRQCSTNPVIQDEYAIPLKLKRGTHEFYCVFSSNSGNGWGICCRFMNKQGKSVPEFIKLH